MLSMILDVLIPQENMLLHFYTYPVLLILLHSLQPVFASKDLLPLTLLLAQKEQLNSHNPNTGLSRSHN